MKKNPHEVNVFITRDIPAIGIDLLQAAGFNVSVSPLERPMEPRELIEQAQKAIALLSQLTDRIDANFLRSCRHLDIISQFSVGYDNINVREATALGIP